CEVRARLLRPVNALIRDDLPTLERPANAISTGPIDGRVATDGLAERKRQSPANSFRPASIIAGSVSTLMRRGSPLVLAGSPGGHATGARECAPDDMLRAAMTCSATKQSRVVCSALLDCFA